MLRPLLAVVLALSGCRQPPPEVRPAPPRQPAFGEARRIGQSVPDAGPTAAGGQVAWIVGRSDSGAELAALGYTDEAPFRWTTGRIELADLALSPEGLRIACSWRPTGGIGDGAGATYSDSAHFALRAVPRGEGPSGTLVSGPWDCRHPSWSPDGTQIVFEIADRGSSRLWTVDVAIPERTYVAEGSDPSWSPDGARIAYVLGADLWTVRPDGTEPKRVTSGFAALSPSWSPDSRWIAFARPDAAGRPDDLWAAAADGSRCVRLTWDPAGEWDPCWAPDGRLYFVSDRGGETALWVASPVNKELLK